MPAAARNTWDHRLHVAALIALAMMPFALVWLRTGAEICMAAACIFFLLHCLAAGDWAWLRSPLALLAAFTWAWLVLVVSPLAIDVAPSLQRAAGWGRYPLFFIAVTHWILRDLTQARLIALVNAALLAFILADTILQYAHGASLFGNLPKGERLSGPFSNVKVGIYTARMMFPVLGFLIWRGLARGARMQAVAGAGALLALCMMILLAGERTALLTSLLALALAAIVSAWAYPRARPALIGAALALALALGALWLTQPAVQRRAQMLHEHIAHFAESPYGQLTLVSSVLTRQYWLHGVGMHDFEEACNRLNDAEHVTDHCEMHPHNPYLEWLVETGVVGLACFVALVLLLLRQPLRLLRAHGDGFGPVMAAFGLGTLLVHFFPFMFGQSTVSNWPAMVLWLSLSLNAAFMAQGMRA